MTSVLHGMRSGVIQQLELAREEYRCGRTLQATERYNRVLKKDMLALFHEPSAAHGWHLCAEDRISLDHVVWLLSGYYFHTRKTSQWNRLLGVLRAIPDYELIPLSERVEMESIYTIRNLARSVRLPEIVSAYQRYLQAEKLSDLARGLAYHVLSQAALVIRDEDATLGHLASSESYIKPELHAVYYLENIIQRATIYYLNNRGRRAYFERAIVIYQEAETLARELDSGHDFTYSQYSLGWIYAELDQLELALETFSRGLQEAQSTDAAFKVAQYHYGLGYVHSQLGDHRQAIDALHEALYFFAGESYLYSATCLNLLATSLLAVGDIEGALERLTFAHSNLLKTENPIHLHHVYRQFALIYGRKRDLYHFLYYVFKTYQIKIRLRKPLFPF
jgi:tetratricopeptide (TPR) repeat protein